MKQNYPGTGRGRALLILLIVLMIGATLYFTGQAAKHPATPGPPVRSTSRGQ